MWVFWYVGGVVVDNVVCGWGVFFVEIHIVVGCCGCLFVEIKKRRLFVGEVDQYEFFFIKIVCGGMGYG